MLGVLVERYAPRDLLRRGVDRHRTGELVGRAQELAGDLADLAVGVSAARRTRPSLCSTLAS
jgi:hypothetical protein